MEEVYKKEQEALEKIRNTKYIPEPIKSSPSKNSKRMLKITDKWKPNRLPRPL